MMKKLVSVLLIAAMVFSLAACGGGGASSGTSGGTSEESNPTENVLAGKTYEYVSMQSDGKDVEIPEGIKGRKLTFKDDGSFVLTGYRDEEHKFTVKDMTGTYTVEGDSLTMTINQTPDSIVYDDEELNASNEDMEESSTDHAIISGDDLNFSLDLPKYDDQGNETGETEHQTYVYSLVK